MRKWAAIVAMAATLAGCGGGDPAGNTTATTPVATTAAASCSLADRQNWALATLREWYLFPETLPASLDPAPYATVGDYVDALTATARAQGRDRYFTYLTSIAGENAYYASGSSAGFGIRLSTDATAGRVFVAEAFENTPALAAGLDRGTEILGIGTSVADLKPVSQIIAASGVQGVTDALGPSTTGTTRLLRVTDAAGQRDVSVTKADYVLDPVSARYGATIIHDGGRQVGYINLRTFIDTADPELRAAFARFKAAGITDVIIDLRYNGGGLVSISELIGDLLGGARSASDVLDYTVYRPEKAANDTTRLFQPNAASIAPTHVAFIGTAGTASASELTINAQIPYLHANAALIGTNTYGKPVGQVAIDRAACDDRLRVIAFATQNAAHTTGYFTGLASVVEASCQAGDDYTHQLGDPAEASTRAALNFIEGVGCTRISSDTVGTRAATAGRRDLLQPQRPTTEQREVPGSF